MMQRKTKHFKIVYTPGSSLGGWAFRAMSNGQIVKLQERSPSGRNFHTVATISFGTWEKFAEKNDLYNPYNDNPAIIERYMRDLSKDA